MTDLRHKTPNRDIVPVTREVVQSLFAVNDTLRKAIRMVADSHPGDCEFCIALGREEGDCNGTDLKGEERRDYCTETMVNAAIKEAGKELPAL